MSGCSGSPCGNFGERQIICTVVGNSLCILSDEIFTFLSQGAVCGPCREAGEEPSSNSIIVYPNPFGNHLNIQLGKEYNRIRVIDIKGGLIKMEILDQPDQQFEIEMSSLPKGIYILEVRFSNGKTIRRKVVKA